MDWLVVIRDGKNCLQKIRIIRKTNIQYRLSLHNSVKQDIQNIIQLVVEIVHIINASE